MNIDKSVALAARGLATVVWPIVLFSTHAVADPTPVLQYTFNETGPVAVGTGSTAVDLPMSKWNGSTWVTNDNHGAAGTGVSGLAGDRAYYDTSLSYINLGNQDSHFMGGFSGSHPLESVENLTALTIQGWFRTPAGQPLGIGESTLIGNMGFSENHGGWKLATRGDTQPDHVGRLSFFTGAVDFTNNFAIRVVSDPVFTETDQWVFFAMTYTPGENFGQVDYYKGTTSSAVTTAGTNFTDTLTNGAIKHSDSGFYIGNGGNESSQWYQGRAFNGKLDNMRVYNTVLTPSEIESLRQADLAPSLPGPTAAPAMVSGNFNTNTVGAPIVTQGGGVGWSTNWASDALLSGTTPTNVTVAAAGSNRAELPTTAGNGGTAFRGLSTPLADTPNNTVYVSFDAQNLNDSQRFFGLSLFNGTAERMLIGQSSNFSNWTVNNMAIAAPGTVNSGIDTSTAANLLVKIVFGGQNVAESVTFWVNPVYGQAETSAANIAARIGQYTTSADWGTIDRVRIGGGNTSGVVSYTAHWIDNLLLQDSTPFLQSLLGDYNQNGVVDSADYVWWRNNDGTVAGYQVWRANFGNTAGAGSGVNVIAANVPEPTTLVLSVLSLALSVSIRNGSANRRRVN